MTTKYDKMSKTELIEAILYDYGIKDTENVFNAMCEAFRVGWLRGEKYGQNSYDVINKG